MPEGLTPFEEDLLAALSPTEFAHHCESLADTLADTLPEGAERDDDRALTYLRATLRGWGVAVTVHRFEALASEPGEAQFTLARRNAPVPAITHPYSAATAPQGLTAELRPTAPETAPEDGLPGAIALVDGVPTSQSVARIAAEGALALVYISPDETLRPAPVPNAGGDEAPAPVISIGRAAGEGFLALCAAGPTPVRLQAASVWRRRRLALPVATIPGVEEPHEYLVVGARAVSNEAGVVDAAGLLELCRVLARHGRRLRRGVRFAWWPAGAAPVAGPIWYTDHAWEELARHVVAYLDFHDLASGRMRGWWGQADDVLRPSSALALRDAGQTAVKWLAASPAGLALPFTRLGIPAVTLAARAGRRKPASEPRALVEALAIGVPLLARLCSYPVVPGDPGEVARAIEQRVLAVLDGLGDGVELGPLRSRAAVFRAATERLQIALLHLTQASSTNYEDGLELANRLLRRLNRLLLPVLRFAGDPYGSLPIAPATVPLPGLDAALAASALSDQQAEPYASRLLVLAWRERNRAISALDTAIETIDEALSALRPLGFG
ncbi:MAG: hypothetical protein ACTHMU_23100 [Thermomicrobiales bacterium]